MSTRAAGNTYLPFVDLMRLETINDATYRSTAQPFCPGGTHIRSAGRAYGGHAYAQAAWAAAQTVPEGFVLHVSSMSSNHLGRHPCGNTSDSHLPQTRLTLIRTIEADSKTPRDQQAGLSSAAYSTSPSSTKSTTSATADHTAHES